MGWGGIFPLHTANKEASERAPVGEGRGCRPVSVQGTQEAWARVHAYTQNYGNMKQSCGFPLVS